MKITQLIMLKNSSHLPLQLMAEIHSRVRQFTLAQTLTLRGLNGRQLVIQQQHLRELLMVKITQSRTCTLKMVLLVVLIIVTVSSII